MSKRHATSTLWHGVLMEIFELGVLLTGNSGIGKSELALDLISRGHRLIADDTPELSRISPHVIQGCCPINLCDFLEVRGLGILNIRRLFGDQAVKQRKRIHLIIHLLASEEQNLNAEARLQGIHSQCTILGVNLPKISLPIAPGRNLAVLVECAVRNHHLHRKGYHADQDLAQRLQKEISSQAPCG